MAVLHFGSTIRQTDATAINAQSSRSHAVFSLNLIQKKPRPQSEQEKRFSVPIDMMAQGGEAGYITVDSKLHFVDLAGSERLKVCFIPNLVKVTASSFHSDLCPFHRILKRKETVLKKEFLSMPGSQVSGRLYHNYLHDKRDLMSHTEIPNLRDCCKILWAEMQLPI